MPQLGQAQVGSLRSTPKQLKVTAADKYTALFRNMGNNHNVPLFWASTATIEDGDTEVTLASGIKFYDMDLASYCNVTATPTSNPGSAYWVESDKLNNVLKLVAASAVSGDVDFRVQFMLGADIDISTLSSRGTGAPASNYP